LQAAAGAAGSIAAQMAEPRERPAGRRRRSSRDRLAERVLGVAGLAALLLVLAVSVSLVVGAIEDGDGEREATASATATPTATPSPTRTPKPTPTPERLTAGERTERDAAAEIVRSRGFEVERLRDWDPDDTLRVLVGRSDSGELAFFFVNGDYIGNDTGEPSADLRVRRTSDLSVTLRYRTYAPGDDDRPTGDRVDVRFTWDGVQLTPASALPDPTLRTPGRQAG
jgi:hypothetical protein